MKTRTRLGAGVVVGAALLAATAHGANLQWATTSGDWDTTSANWTGDNTVYTDGGVDSVGFGTPASDSTVTVQGGGVTPAAMTVSNTAYRYTFTGGAVNSVAGIDITGTAFVQFDAASVMGPASNVTIGQGSQITPNFANFGGSSSSGDLSLVNTASRGAIVFSQDSTAAIDLTGYHPAIALGSSRLLSGFDYVYARLSGTITPAADEFRFTGGGGPVLVASVLADGVSSRSLLADPLGITPTYTGRKPLIILSQPNTYSDTTRIRNADVRLAGASGSATNSSMIVEYAGILCLDPGMRRSGWGNEATVTAGNLNDRIGDTAAVSLRGGTLYLFGNPNTGTTENGGTLEIGTGHSVADARYTGHELPIAGAGSLVTHNTLTGNQSCELTFAALAHAGGGQLLVRGNNLGGSGATGASRIKFTPPPTLAGGGGGAGSPTIGIIPYFYTDTPRFITHDATLGLRALDLATEFSALSVGTTTTNNVIVDETANVTHTISADTTMNSFFSACSGQTTTIDGSGRLILSSGALMLWIRAPGDGGTWTMSAPIDFDGQEGHIYYFGRSFYNAYFNSPLSNTGGKGVAITAVIGSYMSPLRLGGACTFTGPLTLNRGSLQTTASERIPDASDVRVRGGSELIVGGSLTETFGSLSGIGTLTLNNANSDAVIGSGATVNGAVVLDGTGYIAPGDGADGIGTLTLGGGASVRLAGGELRIQIDASDRYDRLAVGAVPVTLGTKLVLTLVHQGQALN